MQSTALSLTQFERVQVQETVLGIQKARSENLEKYQEVQLQTLYSSNLSNLHTTNERPAKYHVVSAGQRWATILL